MLQQNPKVELVSFCDIKKSLADNACKLFGSRKAKTFNRAQDMFKDQVLDTVYFILPPFAHGCEFEAIDRNIPFFVEKPINLNLGQAKEISNEIEKNKLITSVGYMNRYRKGVKRAKELLKEDPALLITGRNRILESPTIFLENNELWQYSKEKCGGQLHEMATHSVDLARYLCGEVSEVHAFGYQDPRANVDLNNFYEANVVNLKFKNGAVGSIWASYASKTGFGEKINLCLYSKRTTSIFEDWGTFTNSNAKRKTNYACLFRTRHF